MNLEALRDPFNAEDIEWRIQTAGKTKDGKLWALVVPYVTNRAIQERLDTACGAENWQNIYQPGPDGGVLCGIALKCGDEWVTKWDGAENTHIEPVKGGLSDAMKRAAVQWGIGRHLYKLDAAFAKVHDGGRNRSKVKIDREDVWIRWDEPAAPKDAAQPPEPEGKGYLSDSQVRELTGGALKAGWTKPEISKSLNDRKYKKVGASILIPAEDREELKALFEGGADPKPDIVSDDIELGYRSGEEVPF